MNEEKEIDQRGHKNDEANGGTRRSMEAEPQVLSTAKRLKTSSEATDGISNRPVIEEERKLAAGTSPSDAQQRIWEAVRREAQLGYDNFSHDIINNPKPEVPESTLLEGALSLMQSKDVPEDERRTIWVGLQKAHTFRLHQTRLCGEHRQWDGLSRYSPLYQEECIFGYGAGLEQIDPIGRVERVTAGPDFCPSCLLVSRVTACVGWAVHGLVFEFANGIRMGYVLDNSGFELDLTDANLVERGCDDFTYIAKGDYLVSIRGNRLANRKSPYMCHSITLDFASGRSITYASQYQRWRGEPFSCEIPQPCLVYKVSAGFANSGDARGLVTTIHLPISKGNMAHLPLNHQRAVLNVLWSLRKVGSVLETEYGAKSIGDDVWWHVLGYLLGWHLEVENDIGQAALESFNIFEEHAWGEHDVRESLVGFGWNLNE